MLRNVRYYNLSNQLQWLDLAIQRLLWFTLYQIFNCLALKKSTPQMQATSVNKTYTHFPAPVVDPVDKSVTISNRISPRRPSDERQLHVHVRAGLRGPDVRRGVLRSRALPQQRNVRHDWRVPELPLPARLHWPPLRGGRRRVCTGAGENAAMSAQRAMRWRHRPVHVWLLAHRWGRARRGEVLCVWPAG